MIRDWLALAGLVIVLTFALSYLTRSAARRSKSMLRRRRDAAKGKEEQEQRSPRNTRIVISLFDGIARLRYGLGFSESSSQEGSVWQALSYPRFRWYFAGSAVSNFGTWLQNGAQVVLAFQLTHSVAWVGILAGAQFLFPLVLGPWAISVVQRLGNWHTLVFAQYLSMSISATLTVLQFCHLLSIRGLAIGALAMGFCFTFALPAQSVTVPSLVSPTETKRALALDSVSYNLGRALAPIFSVALFLTVGFSWIFALNAASFAFFAAVLLRLKRHDARAEIHRPSAGNGFRMAWHDRRILILLLMVAAVTVASDPIMVLGPKVAHTLGASADWSDLFIAALGTGHVLGTLRPTQERGIDSPRSGGTRTAIGSHDGVYPLALALAKHIQCCDCGTGYPTGRDNIAHTSSKSRGRPGAAGGGHGSLGSGLGREQAHRILHRRHVRGRRWLPAHRTAARAARTCPCGRLVPPAILWQATRPPREFRSSQLIPLSGCALSRSAPTGSVTPP